jgi:hypothetical protein
MDVSGEIHVQAALTFGNSPPVHIGQQAGWAPGYGEEKNLTPTGKRTPAFQPVDRHYTVWAIPILSTEIRQSVVTMEMNCRDLSTSCRSEQYFVSVHRVYSVSTDNILMWKYEVQYTIRRRRITVDYLCLSFMENGNKHRPRRIIRYIQNSKEIRMKAREIVSKAYIKKCETSCLTVRSDIHPTKYTEPLLSQHNAHLEFSTRNLIYGL